MQVWGTLTNLYPGKQSGIAIGGQVTHVGFGVDVEEEEAGLTASTLLINKKQLKYKRTCMARFQLEGSENGGEWYAAFISVPPCCTNCTV